MEFDIQIGSPTGMGQLIKYFETQSRQLDQQTVPVQPVSFNPEFESLIRFKGVPILPPAITTSRRDELLQYKKDAILLEKRLKARHLQTQSKDTFPVTNQAGLTEIHARPIARQLNFDVDFHQDSSSSIILQDRLAASSSFKTTVDSETVVEDFGLQTIDSVSSEFTTMDETTIPKVFNGLVLTSFKEQKISYDLDRLSRALNVQELTSTSGSDLSDFVLNIQNENIHNLDESTKKSVPQGEASAGDEQTVSFCHESQDTVVEVSPETGDNTSTSGFVDSTHLDHTHSSQCSSPGYGSANTTVTVDSQRSSRSSPKSLKGAVHFASFVTEYNTRLSQTFEKPTVITKKITEDDIKSSSSSCDSVVMPIIGNPSEVKLKQKVESSSSDVMTLPNQDCDTCPSIASVNIPFQMYSKSEVHNSDKENERVGNNKHIPHGHRKLLKHEYVDKKYKHSDIKNNFHHSLGIPPLPTSSLNNSQQTDSDSEVSGTCSSVASSKSKPLNTSASCHSSHQSSDANYTRTNLSVSDSQRSSRSAALTITSESSSNTIIDDLSIQDTTSNNKTNTVSYVHSQCNNNLMTSEIKDSIIDRKSSKNTTEASSFSVTQESEESKTPQRTLTRRGSYTLSEPSPALLRARSKLEAERRLKEKAEQQHSSKHQIESSIKTVSAKHIPSLESTEFVRPSGALITSHIESEGKAEHINRYLSQVHFQNSMNFSWEPSLVPTDNEISSESVNGEEIHGTKNMDSPVSVLEVIKSIVESQGTVDSLNLEDIFTIHQQQMELKRQELMKQQQRDMEELFVQQRREVMLLEAEIKAAQQLEREQQEFIIQNAPENIKVKAKNHEEEFSPEQSFDNEQQAKNSISKRHTSAQKQSLPSQAQSTETVSSEDVYSGRNRHIENVHFSKKHEQLKKNNDSQIFVKGKTSEILKGKMNKIPEFSPSQPSSSNHRSLVIRSPLKATSLCQHNEIIAIPSEVLMPEMKAKFDKVSAVAKGFLTRCLLRSDKVQELIKTINDTREFAFNFQTETPIKKGKFTPQDTALLERIIVQLQAALLDIHEIFFVIPVSERMALIEQTRMKENEKRIKASSDSMRESGPKISQATLKALERKRKAREAEASVYMNSIRPKTAPPGTNNKSYNLTDISGPIKRHYGFLLSRALKPLTSHSQVSKPESSRSDKERPRTAPEKPQNKPKRITAPSIKPALSSSNFVDCGKDSIKEGVNSQGPSNTNRPVIKTKITAGKPTNQPTKSWR